MILLAGAQSVQFSCFKAFSLGSLFCILIVALTLSKTEALSFFWSLERAHGSVW